MCKNSCENALNQKWTLRARPNCTKARGTLGVVSNYRLPFPKMESRYINNSADNSCPPDNLRGERMFGTKNQGTRQPRKDRRVPRLIAHQGTSNKQVIRTVFTVATNVLARCPQRWLTKRHTSRRTATQRLNPVKIAKDRDKLVFLHVGYAFSTDVLRVQTIWSLSIHSDIFVVYATR